jgi:hypothetical protein
MQLSKESKEASSGKLPGNSDWDLLWQRPDGTSLHMIAYLPNPQQEPGNLCHNDSNAAALSKLISHDAVQNVAGFALGKPSILLLLSLSQPNIN